MKLKHHKDFPKKFRFTNKCIIEDYQYKYSDKIDYVNAYNQALDECGEIDMGRTIDESRTSLDTLVDCGHKGCKSELIITCHEHMGEDYPPIPERLDEEKIYEMLCDYTKEDLDYDAAPITAIEAVSKAICQKFGTPKIDEGKIERIIDKMKSVSEIELYGRLYYVDRKLLAKAIVKELRG